MEYKQSGVVCVAYISAIIQMEPGLFSVTLIVSVDYGMESAGSKVEPCQKGQSVAENGPGDSETIS